MIVMIDKKQEQIIEPNLDELNEWWTLTTADIFQKQRFIHCVEINGFSLYEGYEKYLVDHISDIERVNIKTISRIESVEDTEKALDEYLKRFIPGSLKVSEYLYGDLSEDLWKDFSDFIVGLEWIVKALEFDMVLFKSEGVETPEYLSILDNLGSFISEMDNCLQQQDYVSVGDIIQFEIVPLLEIFSSRRSGSKE